MATILESISRFLSRLADTQAVAVGSGMDSNHELDKILKSRNLLILQSR
jgi:hypothetical protein